MVLKNDMHQLVRNQWKVDLCHSPAEAPLQWCYGFWLPCCFAYQQRDQLLEMTGEPYLCCAGAGPCSTCSCCPCAQPCESKNPWLCLEACCCTHAAIVGNRFMMQTRFSIGNDPCDAALLALVVAFECIFTIFSQVSKDKDEVAVCDCLHQTMMASFCSCMLTQQSVQLEQIQKEIEKTGYQGIPKELILLLPPMQQDMLRSPRKPTPQYGATVV